MRRVLCACAIGALACGVPGRALAHAVLQVQSADGAGEGFNDPTPVAPVGGNTGTTLGEQRTIAVQYAADLWGEALDSDVPIVIEATFDDLGCTTTNTTVLAFASAAAVEIGIDRNGADPSLAYPEPLADRLWGSDLAPGMPDIIATFNSSVDGGCMAGLGWYYGLDGNHGDLQDLVLAVTHELGHGLGVQVFVDGQSGAWETPAPSAFGMRVLDLSTGKHWTEMSDAERAVSYTNVRHVVWDGPFARQAASSWLVEGQPVVGVTPVPAGFSGFAGDAAFGGPLAVSTMAPLVTASSGCPNSGLSGHIALLYAGCASSGWAAAIEGAGAVGALMTFDQEWDEPPPSIEELDPEPVTIPVLSVSSADADLLRAATQTQSVQVSLSLQSGLRGADANGDVLLNATEPASAGSSISHWDVLARPNLLMEPFETPGEGHELDITPSMLADIGWRSFCGNGEIGQDEQCDDGGDNSDTAKDACRSDCTRAHCGDGVVDSGEACDDGADNGDTNKTDCRGDCTLPSCGDGVLDPGEACDEGADNSDSAPNACREDCSTPRCGDGVADRGEQCDEGADNTDTQPNGCRTNCERAGCGDGVVDQGEQCDDGADNDDDKPDACRTDCTRAGCGDGVVDQGEQCDDGADNSDQAPGACRSDCMLARCGDGVVDPDELCDLGTQSRAGDCRSECGTQRDAGGSGASTRDAGVEAGGAESGDAGSPHAGGQHANGTSCSCRVAGAASEPSRAPLWCALCAPAAVLARRRRRARVRRCLERERA